MDEEAAAFAGALAESVLVPDEPDPLSPDLSAEPEAVLLPSEPEPEDDDEDEPLDEPSLGRESVR